MILAIQEDQFSADEGDEVPFLDMESTLLGRALLSADEILIRLDKTGTRAHGSRKRTRPHRFADAVRYE